jgi:hypothetical protein
MRAPMCALHISTTTDIYVHGNAVLSNTDVFLIEASAAQHSDLNVPPIDTQGRRIRGLRSRVSSGEAFSSTPLYYIADIPLQRHQDHSKT